MVSCCAECPQPSVDVVPSGERLCRTHLRAFYQALFRVKNVLKAERLAEEAANPPLEPVVEPVPRLCWTVGCANPLQPRRGSLGRYAVYCLECNRDRMYESRKRAAQKAKENRAQETGTRRRRVLRVVPRTGTRR